MINITQMRNLSVYSKRCLPADKWVEGSNYVDVVYKIDPRTNRIIMMGAIDNLVKGQQDRPYKT